MKKILVIEDEHAYAKVLTDQLSTKGYAVSKAQDGKKGLVMIQKEKPDLVLLDIRMPKMDGLEVLHELRNNVATKNTKVIMLTNLEPDDKIIGKMIETEPTFYCVKSDTSLADLLEKIESVIG